VFGDLKFVAVHDLGELGPKESAGVVAYWGLVNNLSGLAVWAVLIAAFVLLRENHTPKALLILVPVIAVYVLWTGIKFILSHCTGMPSAAAVILDTLVAGFTVGMASVLLVAGRFQKTNRFVIVIAAFMVMALAFGVAVAGSMQFDEEMVQLGMFFGVMTLAGLTALVVAGVCCRRHFGAIKFVIWLGVWAVLLCMGMFLAVVSVTALVLTAQGKDIPFWDQIPQFLTAGGIVGGILYVFLLPFVVFALKSDLFRERFYECFRLRGMVQSQASEVVNDWRTT